MIFAKFEIFSINGSQNVDSSIIDENISYGFQNFSYRCSMLEIIWKNWTVVLNIVLIIIYRNIFQNSECQVYLYFQEIQFIARWFP